MSGIGVSTSAISVGGQPGPGSPGFNNTVETWDGTSWTEVSEINTARTGLGGSGSNSEGGLVFGGATPPNTLADVTESWNGSSWTELADLSTARKEIGGTGISSLSAIAFGGRTPPASSATEEWNVPLVTKTIGTD